VGLTAVNSEVLAYTDANARGVLRIRHLFDQNIKDFSTTYEQPITELLLTSCGYIILLNSLKQIEVSLLTINSEISLKQIQTFKKGGLTQLAARGCRLVAVSNSSVDLYEYSQAEKAKKTKY
jgi:hypothetical protein